jgi:hypothetical protein
MAMAVATGADGLPGGKGGNKLQLAFDFRLLAAVNARLAKLRGHSVFLRGELKKRGVVVDGSWENMGERESRKGKRVEGKVNDWEKELRGKRVKGKQRGASVLTLWIIYCFCEFAPVGTNSTKLHDDHLIA